MKAQKQLTLVATAILAAPLAVFSADWRASGDVKKIDSVEALMDNPDDRVGQVIEVSGEVEHKVSERQFVLESGGILDHFNDEILVLVSDDINRATRDQIEDDQNVTVIGTLRKARVNDIDRELPWWSANPNTEIDRQEERYWLIAHDIRTDD